MATRYSLDRGPVRGHVEFDSVEDAIRFGRAFGLIEPESGDESEFGIENLYKVDPLLWKGLKNGMQQKILNTIIERRSITAMDLALLVGDAPRAIGRRIMAIRAVAKEAGLDPAKVVRTMQVPGPKSNMQTLISTDLPDLM